MADQDSPSRRTVEAQLSSVRFVSAIERGRWSVLLMDWPSVYVRVTAADIDTGKTFSHDFRVQCDGFPEPGPFVERWSFAEDDTHGLRPPRSLEGAPGYIDAMKDWAETPGVHGGIYRAWQRIAANHGDWAAKRPDLAWNRMRNINFIMEQLHEIVAEQASWLATQA